MLSHSIRDRYDFVALKFFSLSLSHQLDSNIVCTFEIEALSISESPSLSLVFFYGSTILGKWESKYGNLTDTMK